MKSGRCIILSLVIALMAGCGGGGGGGAQPTPLSVAITPPNPTVAKGLRQQFTATGTFSGNIMQDVTTLVAWRSTVPTVATINAAGTASTVGLGTTRIKAVFGNVSSAVTLTVTPAVLASIAVTPPSASIAAGATQQFVATGTLTDGTTQPLTTSVSWSSLAPFVATVSNTAGSNGLATGVSPGETTIKATSGSIWGSATLTVTGGTAAANVLPITVNGSLCSSAFNATYPNKPCVSVTVCTPGTATCQTVTDILLDTGSYGLRVFSQALTVPLPQIAVAGGNLAECVQFADGSADWGPVKSADVVLGGESAVTVPIQLIDSTFGSVPAGCGIPDTGPAAAGFNGILGVGLFDQDCGPGCVSNSSNGRYFACSGSNCPGTAVPLASQVRNPVAALPVDNNGVLVLLPNVPLGGEPSADGYLVLGINTQTNNVPSGVTAYRANQSGDFTTIFNGSTFFNSFIDSGSNGLFFSDPAIPTCSGWFCPPSVLSLSAVTEGFTGTPSATVPFQIGNSTTLFNSGNRVFAELGGSLPGVGGFDWGLPFFYGRSVFVGINGVAGSSLGTGPFWAY